MPKVKTHSATKKRFRRVGSGKIKRAKAYRRHLLTKKTSKCKRDLREKAYISKADFSIFKVLLPCSR